MRSVFVNELPWLTRLHGKLMKPLAKTRCWRGNAVKRKRGEGEEDKYASGYDVQLTLLLWGPFIQLKLEKSILDTKGGLQVTMGGTHPLPPSPTPLLVHAALGRTGLGSDKSKSHQAKCTNLKLQCGRLGGLCLMDCKLMDSISTP